jgi:hypothetical protein
VYGLPQTANATKSKLVATVHHHFKRMPLLTEQEIITYFIHFAKTRKDEAKKKDKETAKKSTSP